MSAFLEKVDLEKQYDTLSQIVIDEELERETGLNRTQRVSP